MANSYVQYTGDGTTTNFSVTFPYLDAADVGAKVGGVTTAFTWVNSTTVQISPAPASGTVVELRRTTPSTVPLVDFQNGAIVTEDQLDTNAKQSLYVAQEDQDNVSGAMNLDATGQFDARSKRIKNVATPIADTDAATKAYADSVSGADQAAAAAASASAAATSETNAAASAAAAATSATNAANSASDAVATLSTALKKDGSEAMAGALDMGTHAIHNVVDPSSVQDAATKHYVDAQDAATLSSAETYADTAVNAVKPIAYAYATVSAGVVTLQKSSNIASITRVSIGLFEIAMTTAAADTNYRVHFTQSAGGNTYAGEWSSFTRTTTNFRLFMGADNAGSTDPGAMSITVWA